MTIEDCMKESKESRDQRSRDMNPTYHQYWESRGSGKYDDGEKSGPEIYALWSGCERCGYFLETSEAYVTQGQDWVKVPYPNDNSDLNYLFFCGRCGNVSNRNFNWTDLDLTNEAYRLLIEKLGRKVGVRIGDGPGT
jgi:hypothetical protein